MNTRFSPRLTVLALVLGGAALSACADSFVASSAAGGSSASSASSASSDKSSDSSKQTKQTAEGPYRIVDVAAVPERPDTLRVKLQALAATDPTGDAAAEFILYLPQQAFERSRLAVGGTVTASQRPYGTEFADAGTHQAFFLVVSDDWYRELAANPVTL